jgi:protein-tyrosine phosphatase
VQVGSPRYGTAGGIHRIPVDEVAGSLYLTGFSVVGPDPAAALDDVGAATLVCLIEPDEIERRFPDFATWLVEPSPHAALHHPTPDQGVVDDDAVVTVAAHVLELLRDGHGVMLHCGAGMGRTGTVAALVLMATGVELDDALATIRAARPGAGPDGPDQLAQLRRLAARFGEIETSPST